jgi:hypothetical protein
MSLMCIRSVRLQKPLTWSAEVAPHAAGADIY